MIKEWSKILDERVLNSINSIINLRYAERVSTDNNNISIRFIGLSYEDCIKATDKMRNEKYFISANVERRFSSPHPFLFTPEAIMVECFDLVVSNAKINSYISSKSETIIKKSTKKCKPLSIDPKKIQKKFNKSKTIQEKIEEKSLKSPGIFRNCFEFLNF